MVTFRYKAFLLLVFSIFSVSVSADVLILKNGKKLQGTILHEDDKVYELRDSAGIVLTVKKSQVDAEETQKLNTEQKAATEISKETKSESKSENASVADLARAARANRTGTARTLRKEDLEQTPELSIIGTTQSEESVEDHSAPPDRDHFAEAEDYWKNETYKFKDELDKAREDAEALTKECDDLNKQAAYAIVDPTQYIIINGVLVPVSGGYYSPDVIQQAQQVCDQAEQAKKDVVNIQKDLEKFQERARRQGALPGWIDPDRLP